MATTTMPSSSGGAEKPAGKKVERAKEIVKDIRQPSDQENEDVKTGGDSSATGKEGDGGNPNATGDGPPGLGIGLGCLDPSRCGDGDMPSLPTADPTPEARNLPPTVLSELERMAGDPQIQPPTSTQNAMRQGNTQRALAVVKMCLNTDGGVERAGIVRSSGYAEYDAKLLSKMRRWRYRPYRASGNAIAICTHVTFIYKQE